VVATVAILVGLAGPAAYSLQTAATAHTGSIPSAGPAVSATFAGGPPGTGGGAGGPGPFGGPTGALPSPPGALAGGGPGGGAGGGPGGGGLLDAATPSSALVEALNADAGQFTWVAATVGSNNAAGYQLATGRPVMAIGGFNGSDPSPTLEQFQQWVASGKIHYFIPGGGLTGQGMNSSGTASAITDWVEQHYPATTVGGVTMYDLTSATAA
jgi:hypothetical protein